MTNIYEQYRNQRLADAEFRAHYELHRAEIDAVDRVVADIEARRAALGLTKADLARLVGRKPESVRRLLSGKIVNPTLTTVSEMVTVLGMEITVKPTASVAEFGPEVKQKARELAASNV